MPGNHDDWVIQLGVSPDCFEGGSPTPEAEAPDEAANSGSSAAQSESSSDLPGQPVPADAGSTTSAELSGAAWVNKFPGSTSLDDLKDPFKTNCKDFVAA